MADITYIKLFVDYLNAIEPLGDAERGRLFTSLLEYARSGEAPQLNGNERFLFPMMRAQIDRDNASMAGKSEERSKAGKLGAEAKQANARFAKQNKQMPDLLSKTSKDKDKDKDKDEEKEKEKEKEKKESAVSQPSPAALDEFFNSVWRLYPVKRGKGQVSQSKRLILYKIGFERISLAISRYLEDLKGDTWRKPQNGSTFFSSGYIDYLDENYTPSERRDANGRPQGGGSEVPLYGHYV